MDNKHDYITEQIQDLLKQISLNVSHVLSKVIDDSPLTAHQMYIMKVIKKNPRINLTSLCNDLNLSKGAMSLTLNRLVEEGLVLRKANMVDRRNIDIVLTQKGERILDDTKKKLDELFRLLTSSLSLDEMVEIKTSLKKLNASILSVIDRIGVEEKL